MSTVSEGSSKVALDEAQRTWLKKMGAVLDVPLSEIDADGWAEKSKKKPAPPTQPTEAEKALVLILKEFSAINQDLDKAIAALVTLKASDVDALAKRKTDLRDRMASEVKVVQNKPTSEGLDKLRAICKDAKMLLEDCKKSLAAAKQKAIDDAKKAYEDAFAKIKADSDKAEAADTAEQLPLETCKAAFMKKLTAMKDLAAKADYAGAVKAVADVAQAAKTLNDQIDKYAECKKLLYVDGNADRDYLRLLERNSPPSEKTRDALTKYKAMMRLYHAGKYDDCMTAFKELQKGIADLKKAVGEADKLAQPKADKAAKKFEELAGNKKLSTLDARGEEKLVKELKKLSLKEQTDLLADLHGPSGKLDAEGRLMQRAMYKAMSIDKEFEKADKKKREAYRAELASDTEIQDAVADWNAQKGGKDVVSAETKQKVFEKVLKVQSKHYGIPVPAIRWYDGAAGSFGSFNTTSGIISLNRRYLSDPEEMINTILHENAHNYQDQLAKRYFAGEIKESDPVYAQAKAFALTHHMDAYVPHREDSAVYKSQPEEMHAWDVGDKEAPKLMKGLRKAKKKRDKKGGK